MNGRTLIPPDMDARLDPTFPVPWELHEPDSSFIVKPIDGSSKQHIVAKARYPEIARYIVRAANAFPAMLQALREVVGNEYAALESGEFACLICLEPQGEPHDADCTMRFVHEAIAKAEGRS